MAPPPDGPLQGRAQPRTGTILPAAQPRHNLAVKKWTSGVPRRDGSGWPEVGPRRGPTRLPPGHELEQGGASVVAHGPQRSAKRLSNLARVLDALGVSAHGSTE